MRAERLRLRLRSLDLERDLLRGERSPRLSRPLSRLPRLRDLIVFLHMPFQDLVRYLRPERERRSLLRERRSLLRERRAERERLRLRSDPRWSSGISFIRLPSNSDPSSLSSAYSMSDLTGAE